MVEIYYIRVNGMQDSGCERKIISAVNQLSGVETVEADYETSMIIVKAKIMSDKIIEAIDLAGYNAILLAE